MLEFSLFFHFYTKTKMNNLFLHFPISPFLMDSSSSSKEKWKPIFPNHQNTKRNKTFLEGWNTTNLLTFSFTIWIYCYVLSFESTSFATSSSPKFLSTFKSLSNFASSFPFLVESSKLPKSITTFVFFGNQLKHWSWKSKTLGTWHFYNQPIVWITLFPMFLSLQQYYKQNNYNKMTILTRSKEVE